MRIKSAACTRSSSPGLGDRVTAPAPVNCRPVPTHMAWRCHGLSEWIVFMGWLFLVGGILFTLASHA